MLEQRVSYRYAKAILDIAIESKTVDEIHNDFSYIGNVFKASNELKNIIVSPIVPQHLKNKAFVAVFGDNQISKMSLEFLKLLVHKRRSDIVPSIVEQYNNLYDEYNNKLKVRIISAIELNESSKKIILDNLTNLTKKTIIPIYEINKNVKGGLMVRIGDWVYDSTIKNQLEMLYKKLIEG